MANFSLIKTWTSAVLSTFTDYDKISRIAEAPTPTHEVRSMLRDFAQQQRRALEILIPMTMWHMYKAQDVPVSWGFCLITVTRQIMQGLDEELLLERIRILGPMNFSVIYSIPVLSVYIFYWIQMAVSANSRIDAFVQAMFLMLPHLLSLFTTIKRGVSGINSPSPERLSIQPLPTMETNVV